VVGAGGVIFRKKPNRAQEVFFVKNAYGRWTFPKGKQERGENLVDTAKREANEEAGLTNLKLVAPLGRTNFRFRQEGELIQKTVHFFLFQAAPDAKEKMTGVEGGMWEAEWTPASKALAKNGYRNLDRLLAKALRIIAHSERKSQGFGMRPNVARK
jgi:8-oxo-dGTP pyrophosphatase MutT (NUDIX family)